MSTAPGIDALGTNDPPHVFLALIARHVVTVATFMTAQRLAAEARELGFRVSCGTEESGGIALARNLLSEVFYDGLPKAGWFLSFDDDVGRLRGKDLLRMLQHRVDVVGAPLPGRAVQHTSVRAAIERGEKFDTFQNVHENLSPLLLTYLDDGPRWHTPDLCEVRGTSAGCLLISRHAMKQVMHRNGRFRFNERNPPRIFNFTEDIPDDSYSFCSDWRSLGGHVYVDAHTTLSHRGVIDFTTKSLAQLYQRGTSQNARR